MSAEPPNVKLNPAAIITKDAAKALGMSEDMLKEDIAAGAPIIGFLPPCQIRSIFRVPQSFFGFAPDS